MSRFVMSKIAQADGFYEVHNASTGCWYLPERNLQKDLGEHDSCHEAVELAKNSWPDYRIKGCFQCANACDTG